MEYNSDANAQAAYVSNSSVTATGGTITEVDGYRIHTFASNGTFTIDITTNVEVLVVAGGGGGGVLGGGGGGGGVVYNSAFVVTAQGYTVTIGAGGAGCVVSGGQGSDGSNSVFGSITAIGGGGGGSHTSGTAGTNGRPGGCGGGAGNAVTGGQVSISPGSGTGGQGYAGGYGREDSPRTGGGGGGAGGLGNHPTTSNTGSIFSGGPGKLSSIHGDSLYWGGGGGAGCYQGSATNNGGIGGGGGGNTTDDGGGVGTGLGGGSALNSGSAGSGDTGGAGGANTGGGGGCGGWSTGPGGAGGSGIVIVRYPSPVLSYSEATIKTQGSYAIKSTAPVTTSLNKTLTRTVSPMINLSNKGPVKFDMRATRTGSNIKIGIHDSGGTTTEITPNITSANNYQTVTWNISGVSNANKDVIDQIIVTIVNADVSNTFYIDNFFARNYPNNPSGLGQRRSDDDDAPIAFGNWTNNLTPKATFYLSDNDVGDNVKYRIQVSTKSDFSVNLISHTSVELSQGATHYALTGLSSGSSYYWRVMTIDTYTYTSGWSTANAGDIAVKIDTHPPTGVSISAFSALSYSQIKVWAAAEDAESGLASAPYFIEMSTASDLNGSVSDSGWISEDNYTFSSLDRNTKYYFRVKAKDNVGNISTSTVKEKKTQPGVWQEKTTTRTGPNAFGFEGDGIWTWKVPANGGSLLTITAYVQYNSDYGGAAKPKITLSNYGVNSSAQMTGGADTWEKLTVSGTPSGKGVLFLKVEGFSTAVDAKYFVDDIQISQ